uniref:Protein kinase domain-containing protein n=1 Tax=Angiostrongylus cantonensis TaxID=6313 RepID=A0A158P6C1_ANGCA
MVAFNPRLTPYSPSANVEVVPRLTSKRPSVRVIRGLGSFCVLATTYCRARLCALCVERDVRKKRCRQRIARIKDESKASMDRIAPIQPVTSNFREVFVEYVNDFVSSTCSVKRLRHTYGVRLQMDERFIGADLIYLGKSTCVTESSMVAKMKYKANDEMALEHATQFDSKRQNLPCSYSVMIDELKFLLDWGACPACASRTCLQMLIQAVALHFLYSVTMGRAVIIEKTIALESSRVMSLFNTVSAFPSGSIIKDDYLNLVISEILASATDALPNFYIPKKDLSTVEQLLNENPLLRRLAMFSDSSGSLSQSSVRQKPYEKQMSANLAGVRTLMNHADAGDVNSTLFSSAPTTEPLEIRRKEHDMPFTVTDSLLNSLTNAGISEATIPTRDVTSSIIVNMAVRSVCSPREKFGALSEVIVEGTPLLAKNLRSANSSAFVDMLCTSSSLKKSLFQGVLYSLEPEYRVTTATLPRATTKVVWDDEQYPIQNFIVAEEQVVVPRERGGLTVSGTWYYHDNRVEGELRHKTDELSAEFWLPEERLQRRRSSKEQLEMMQDPRFAIEAELARMNEPTDSERIAQERPKLRRFVGRTGGKKPKKKRIEFDQEPLSTVSILHRGGRLFERRITEIGGKTVQLDLCAFNTIHIEVTVELGNRQLHGADLIVGPGSVVHGSLPSDEERANLDKAKIEKRGFLN